MYLAVTDTITLEDAHNFREFHIATDADVPATVAAFAGRAAASERDNHLWIDIAYVRELAGPAADAEWNTQFESMLAYAATKGWIDTPTNRVEAHLQPPD